MIIGLRAKDYPSSLSRSSSPAKTAPIRRCCSHVPVLSASTLNPSNDAPRKNSSFAPPARQMQLYTQGVWCPRRLHQRRRKWQVKGVLGGPLGYWRLRGKKQPKQVIGTPVWHAPSWPGILTSAAGSVLQPTPRWAPAVSVGLASDLGFAIRPRWESCTIPTVSSSRQRSHNKPYYSEEH